MTACIDPQNLKRIINEEDWDQLLENVKPKCFVNQRSEELPDASSLAQICRILINETVPDVVKILCLKCLGNSCLNSYKYESCILENTESDKYGKNLCNKLAEDDSYECKNSCISPRNPYFSYDGVVKWTVNYIITHDRAADCSTDHKLDMLRLSIQFLCNFFTYAYSNATHMNDNISKYLDCDDLKQTILNATSSSRRPLANAACIYVHNALKNLHCDYFMRDQKVLYQKLLESTKEGFTSAKDALLDLLRRPSVFENVYSSLVVDEKLDLLDIIYNELWESWESSHDLILTEGQVEFLALTFCEKSDLILKTVDTYINDVEPREVILILDILGLVTSMRYKFSTNATRLFINCKYLLMSLHMTGKNSDNYFTPIINLSQVAPNNQGRIVNGSSANGIDTYRVEATRCDPQDHPAFGFKARLIQVIANMVYKNRMCQDLFREMDGIPLLLDCCNIDARNPLILQWTILALRNVCEGNFENQEIIRNCRKEGVLDNTVLQEMGLTLHEDEDGKSVRIAPLRRT